MRHLTSAIRNATIAACMAVTPVAFAPPVAAAPTTNTFQIPMVWNAGIWLCSGIHTYCSANPVAITGETAGVVSFPPVHTNSDGYYWVHWTNISTLQSGTATLARGASPAVFTGTGLVSASMTDDYEVIAGTGVFWVP